jgi:iron complex outermembrane receptor protein
MEYHDMMEFVFDLFGPPSAAFFGLGFKSINVGDTRISGIDISLSGSGSIGKTEMNILAGYTYTEPEPLSFSFLGDTIRNPRNYTVLKYRYKNLLKGDVECRHGKISAGVSVRYNSYMETIDHLFDTGFLTLLPSMANYRKNHHSGDTVFDFRISYQALSSMKVSFITNNMLNHEYVGRPYDMQPPRTFTLQFSLSL